MRGVYYKEIETNRARTGVIAQELEKVLPEVVFDSQDTDPTTGETTMTKTVDYGNVVGLLIEAIKEQQDEIERLRAIPGLNMTLQSSGAISLNDVAGEFGGSTPHSLSEYYGVASGVPSSGTISLSNFYGTSNAQYVYATGGSVSQSGNYRTHYFYGSGYFNITNGGNSAGSNSVTYLIVAGGGGGSGVGGGGGGGYRYSNNR